MNYRIIQLQEITPETERSQVYPIDNLVIHIFVN